MPVTSDGFHRLIDLYVSLLNGGVREVGAPQGLGPLNALIADDDGWRVDGLARTRRTLLDVLAAVEESVNPISTTVPNEAVALALGRLWGVTSPPWGPVDVERAFRTGTRGFTQVPEGSVPRSDTIRKWTGIALVRPDILSSAQRACERWRGSGSGELPPRGDWPRWDPRLDLWFDADEQGRIAARVGDLLGSYSLNRAHFRSVTESVSATYANTVLHRAANQVSEYVRFEPPRSRVGQTLNKLAIGIWNETDEVRRAHRAAQVLLNPPGPTNEQRNSAAVIGQMFVEDSLLPDTETVLSIMTIIEERDAMFLVVTDSTWDERTVTGQVATQQTRTQKIARSAIERFSADLERIRAALLLDPGDALALALEIAKTSDRASKLELAKLYVDKREALSKVQNGPSILHSEVQGTQARRQIAVADQSVALELLYDRNDRTLSDRLSSIIERSNVDGNYPYGFLSTHRDAALRENQRGNPFSAVWRLAHARTGLGRASEISSDRRQALETEHQLSLATAAVLVTMIEKELSIPRSQEWKSKRPTAMEGFRSRCAAAIRWSLHTRHLLAQLEEFTGGLPSRRAADGRYLSWSGWHGLTRQMHVRVLLAVVTSLEVGLVGKNDLDQPSPTLDVLRDHYRELLGTEPMTAAVSSQLVRQATWLALLSPDGRIPVVGDCSEGVPHLLRGDARDLSLTPEPSMRLPMDESALWHAESKDGGILGRLPDDGPVARYFDKKSKAWGEWRAHFTVLSTG